MAEEESTVGPSILPTTDENSRILYRASSVATATFTITSADWPELDLRPKFVVDWAGEPEVQTQSCTDSAIHGHEIVFVDKMSYWGFRAPMTPANTAPMFMPT